MENDIDCQALQKIWLKWLKEENSNGETNLASQARLYVKQIKKIDLPESIHPFYGMDEDDKLQEAWCELYSASENYFTNASIDDLQLIADNQPLRLLSRIREKLINKIREKNRQKRHNIWKYTYKQARAVFTNEPSIFTKTEGNKCQFFSLIEDVPRLADSSLLADKKDYGQWSTPRQFVTDSDCCPGRSNLPKSEQSPSFKSKHLVKLGKHFWHEASDHFNGHYYLPVREFIHYLATFYQWLHPPQKISCEDIIENIPAPASEEEIYLGDVYVKSCIPSLARQCANQWPAKETRHIFYFSTFHDPRLSKSQLARLFSSSPYKIGKLIEKCETQLEEFCGQDNTGFPISSWPKEDIIEFIEQVRKICEPGNSDHILKGKEI